MKEGVLLVIEAKECEVEPADILWLLYVVELIDKEAKGTLVFVDQWIAAYHVVKINVLNSLQEND